MKNRKNVYEVTLDLQVRFKIQTTASSESEAEANILEDLENNSTERFITDYSDVAEQLDSTISEIELKDDPW